MQELTNIPITNIWKFPDGEIHIELSEIDRKKSLSLTIAITSADDLFVFMQIADVLKRQCINVSSLTITYLMGMRCDRLFDFNRPFTLGIVADVINSLGAKKVILIEPHSERSLNLIHNSQPLYMSYFIATQLQAENDNICFVAPDEGSIYRYVNVPFSVICSKVRDAQTGELKEFSVQAKSDVKGRDLLVVDDLCDGGGTFCGLAPKLRELEPKTLSLAVTHAVQLDGIKRVASVYDNVYITDSYKKWGEEELPSNVTVFTSFKTL